MKKETALQKIANLGLRDGIEVKLVDGTSYAAIGPVIFSLFGNAKRNLHLAIVDFADDVVLAALTVDAAQTYFEGGKTIIPANFSAKIEAEKMTKRFLDFVFDNNQKV